MLREGGRRVQDGNAGLVKQALAARQMRQTQRLTQTYLTLSLADIARQIGLASPQQAEQHILRCGASPRLRYGGPSLRMSLRMHCQVQESMRLPG